MSLVVIVYTVKYIIDLWRSIMKKIVYIIIALSFGVALYNSAIVNRGHVKRAWRSAEEKRQALMEFFDAAINNDLNTVNRVLMMYHINTSELDAAARAAIGHGNIDVVERIAREPNFDINFVFGGQTLLHNAVTDGKPDIVEFLLTVEGVIPNIRTPDNMPDEALSNATPLDYANVFNEPEIIEIFHEAGVY